MVEPTPLKNMKVSWDDDIPNIWGNKIYGPNHQPGLKNLLEVLSSNMVDYTSMGGSPSEMVG